MLINKTDILTLKELLCSNDLVALDRIPASFKVDFDAFFLGKTLTKKGNIVFAYPDDVKKWIRYVFVKYQ